MFQAFASQPKNLVISPISLKIILALLYQASSASTAREFQNVLQFYNTNAVRQQYSDLLNSLQVFIRKIFSPFNVSAIYEYFQSSGDNDVELGTTIFSDSPIEIKPNFKNMAKEFFRTSVLPANFSDPVAASKQINNWFREKTHNRVNKFIDPSKTFLIRT